MKLKVKIVVKKMTFPLSEVSCISLLWEIFSLNEENEENHKLR